MNKFAHYFLVGFAVAVMTLFAALALSNKLDAEASGNALNSTVTTQSHVSTVR